MMSFRLKGFESAVWVFIPTVGIMRKKLEVVVLMRVPTAVHFRNLERTSEKNGIMYFPTFFFFFFNNNLQKTAVLYCKQCTGKGLKQLRSIHSEVLLKRLAKLLLDSGGTDLSKSFFWLGVKFSRC